MIIAIFKNYFYFDSTLVGDGKLYICDVCEIVGVCHDHCIVPFTM